MDNQHPMASDHLDAQRRRGRTNLTWILLILTFLLVLAAPTMIVLFFGMLPTLVAYIIDRGPQKSATFCVGGINFIGVFPFIMDLWTGTNEVSAAFTAVKDPFILLAWYASAAFGWLLYLSMPSIISSFVMVLRQRKVAQLRGEQKELIEEWGPEVAALVEMERLEEKEHHLEGGVGSKAGAY